MRVISSPIEMRAACRKIQRGQAQANIGLVPTMGALHDGHLSLIRAAKQRCDQTVVSIFVNPLQFGPNEDFSRYPRTFERDCLLLEEEGVDILFAPSPEAMYPSRMETFVDVPEIGGRLDGASRPGHFRGVTTVVAKLFHVVQPDFAFFGQKDAAQVAVIRVMVRDLNFDVELIVCPTVREESQLAMSSRNRYLTAQERKDAEVLARSLNTVEREFESGERDPIRLRAALTDALSGSPSLKADYAELVDPYTLMAIEELPSETLVAVAAWVGNTRLIDNCILRREEADA